jgi:transcriptional regulator with XRE-family HTH domain
MGYRGKVVERQRARELRAQSRTLEEIATELGVSKSSVSLWVRDVEFVPNPRPRTRGHRGDTPHPAHLAKLAQIERLAREAADDVGQLTDREFMLFGVALYLGEGFKRDGHVGMANTDPTRRHSKHVLGCPAVMYSCTTTSRRVMGLVRALSSKAALPG